MAVTRYFVAHYIESKLGKTGLADVTINIYRISDQVQVITGAAATEIGDGFYFYAYAAADQDEEYVAAFTTADVNVDQRTLAEIDWTARILDGVFDEILTGSKHNLPQSAGRRLRTTPGLLVHEGTAQGPGTGTNQIQLATDASAVDGAYDPSLIQLVNLGTGSGQSRLILQYDGAMRTATVDRDWKTVPDATTEYQILGDAGREHVNEGLAQAGATNTITLNVLASADNDAYNGQVVFIRAGTGADQARRVTDYDGTTRIAIMERNWDTVPDGTSAYVMLPTASFDVATLIAGIADAIVGAGASVGAVTFTYTLTNSVDDLPIADADIWVTTDAGGANVAASGRTDQNGQVTFYLDTGIVYVWRQKTGWNFTNPDVESV